MRSSHLSHVTDDCGFPPRVIRSTRLVDLVNTMDPQSTLIYLADHVDEGRLATR
ncbi:hypothetical protein [Streptomyces racemochromogenes]|uniref:hypothetical protein n=1 Tax=Streptomyces racemochromogenes TaxID=67353 RepID=UPI0031EB917C